MLRIPLESVSNLLLTLSEDWVITVHSITLDSLPSSPLAICTYFIESNHFNSISYYMYLIDIVHFKCIGRQHLHKVDKNEFKEVSIPHNIKLEAVSVTYYHAIDNTKYIHKGLSIFLFVYKWYKTTDDIYKKWLVQFLGYRELLLFLIDRKYSSSSLILENVEVCTLLNKQIKEANQQVEQLLKEGPF